MINNLQKIQERFDKIKDHKPKASNKLNELGDIIASAYKISPDLANEMWSYIINLNVNDNIANAKFYIAQIFNKLSDRLPAEDVTSLVSKDPDRVKLMILYGYDGLKLWIALETLIRGYIKTNSVQGAIACVEYFYLKFDGINSNRTEIYRTAREVALICIEYIKSQKFSKEAEKLIDLLRSSENQDVNSIVEITTSIGIAGVCTDFDMLFYVYQKCNESENFFNLLWEARNQFSLEELRDKLRNYFETCDNINDLLRISILEEDNEDDDSPISYKKSKHCFYNELLKDDDSLLEYYFSRSVVGDVEINLISAWIFENNWEYFTKYVSKLLFSSNNMHLDFRLKHELERYMEASLYDYKANSYNEFGRNYKKLMTKCSESFARSLALISATTLGCPCHEDFHFFIKNYIQKLNGNLDILNDFGFTETVDNRSSFEQLKDFARRFKQSLQFTYCNISAEYDTLMKSFSWDTNLPPKEYVNRIIEQAYKFAKDDDIAEFFFKYIFKYTNVSTYCKDMLSACIRKNDIDRAVELADMMIEAKNPFITITFRLLIKQYSYSNKHNSKTPYHFGERSKAIGITDEMRINVKYLVDRIMPSLSSEFQQDLKDVIHKINPGQDSFNLYIDQLLNDVTAYTTIPRPKEINKAPVLNRIKSKVYDCFEELSENRRADIIGEILLKYSSVIDILDEMPPLENISDDSMYFLFQNYPEIFSTVIQYKRFSDYNIENIAWQLRKCCTKKEYESFKNEVIAKRGHIYNLEI